MFYHYKWSSFTFLQVQVTMVSSVSVRWVFSSTLCLRLLPITSWLQYSVLREWTRHMCCCSSPLWPENEYRLAWTCSEVQRRAKTGGNVWQQHINKLIQRATKAELNPTEEINDWDWRREIFQQTEDNVTIALQRETQPCYNTHHWVWTLKQYDSSHYKDSRYTRRMAVPEGKIKLKGKNVFLYVEQTAPCVFSFVKNPVGFVWCVVCWFILMSLRSAPCGSYLLRLTTVNPFL